MLRVQDAPDWRYAGTGIAILPNQIRSAFWEKLGTPNIFIAACAKRYCLMVAHPNLLALQGWRLHCLGQQTHLQNVLL
jgi:hypothetical protein